MMSKSKRLLSQATSPGIAIGKIKLINPPKVQHSRTWIRNEDVEKEILHLKKGIEISKIQLAKAQAKLNQFEKRDQHAILESLRLLLQDDMLIETTMNHIIQEKINAEWALDKTLAQLKLTFLNLSEASFREKIQDIEYIAKRLLTNLQGGKASISEGLPQGKWILVSHDISPAEIAIIPRDKVKGFITEVGGKTSHSAIIARSLEIPALFGVQNVISTLKDGEEIIIDGMEGIAISSPSEEDLKHYRSLQSKYESIEKLLLRDTRLEATTKDSFKVNIVANMELVEEIPSIIHHGAEGIGLYRTEYLFLNRLDDPSEDEQYQNYSAVLKDIFPNTVVIRTMDLGGDKLPRTKRYGIELNPALGLRSIRLSLRERPIFKAQLRALYRASTHGNLKILLPLVSNLEQLREVKEIIREVKAELSNEKIPFKEDIPLGIMIEVPAAAITADLFAKEVSFFSIGTNDLIQFGLAIDRGNDLVSYLYSPYHPAVIRMLKYISKIAREYNIPLSLCGEVASDPLLIPILVSLGFDTLSMNPASIPFAKKIIRSISKADSEKILEEILPLATTKEVEQCLRTRMKDLVWD